MPARRVVLATFGSLGDLHPYVAIARELKSRGHEAVIATTDVYRDYLASLEVEFAPMHPLLAQIGRPEDHLERIFDPLHGPRYMVTRLVMPYVREAYEDLRVACFDADLLVTHPLAVAGPLLAEKNGMAWVSTAVAPMGMLSSIEAPVFPGLPWLTAIRGLGVLPYRAVFGLLKSIASRWDAPLNSLRRELELRPAPPALFDGQFSPALNLALFSPLLSSMPADWPASTAVCGFARHDGPPPDAQTAAALERFLEGGEPPIVFTLGSAAHAVARGFWSAAVSASERLGRRALLIGPSAVEAFPSREGVFASLPYSMVFPRAMALVHQGGIGTLAQALAAGRPQLVTPVAFDQFDNAARAVRLGVARTVPFAKADADELARELRLVLEDEALGSKARAVGEKVSLENGAAQAADRILALL